ncbi:MAG: RluA family pseudouridine synthase [Polyangiaceae bacterium]
MNRNDHVIVVDVPPELDGERADKGLVTLLAAAGHTTPRTELQRWITEGHVQSEDKPLKKRSVLRAGMRVQITPQDPPLTRAEPDPDVEFSVVYEDEYLLVVDKPAGLVVHPARSHPTGTLVNGLLARGHFDAENADPLDREGHLRPGIVHRIDKNTSGLLVVSRDPTTREALKSLFESHDIQRSYLALTLGNTADATYDTLHGRHPTQRLKFTTRIAEGRPAKRACTHVEQLQRFREASLVRCRLETGRTHQIRVHLAEAAKTPIVGDRLYGGVPPHGPLRELALRLGRQALHAAELGFVHPITGESMHWESPLPPDLAKAKQTLSE